MQLASLNYEFLLRILLLNMLIGVWKNLIGACHWAGDSAIKLSTLKVSIDP